MKIKRALQYGLNARYPEQMLYLKEYRSTYDLTQSELAKVTGYSIYQVKKFEQGARLISPKFAHILEILKDSLCVRVEKLRDLDI